MTKPRLLDGLRSALRIKHYSIRTEDACIQWIKRFICFHNKKHPADMGEAEITAFLSFLAVGKNVTASTQNQALSALLFLYKQVPGVELAWLDEVTRAKRPSHLPTVLPKEQLLQLLDSMSGINGLIARLLYGTGMRLIEVMRLRVQDVDFDYRQIIVCQGKDAKDRSTVLPGSLVEPLQQQLAHAHRVHHIDLQERYGLSSLSTSLQISQCSAGSEVGNMCSHRLIVRSTRWRSMSSSSG